jgi:hypothetical protein
MSRVLFVLIASAVVACGGSPNSGPPSAAAPASPATPATAATQPASSTSAEALRSWNDGAAKRAIVEFVGRVTKEGGPDFVAVAERIATFDNDGTLWAEKPVPFQLMFAFDRVKAMAPPSGRTRSRLRRC